MGIRSIRDRLAERRVENGIMALITGQIAKVFSLIPRPQAGPANTGTYDPKDGTAEFTVGTTAAIITDEGDTPVTPPRVTVATVYSDQYGLRGNEHAMLIPAPTPSGFIALTHHDETDSPGAPAGEVWRVHRKADGTIDHFSKWTNDGSTPGDNLGGQVHSGFGLHEVETKGGLSTVHDDTAKQIKKTANAQTYTIWDAQGNAISHVASEVGLGDLASNLDATTAAMRKSDLSTYESSRQNTNLQDFIKYANLLSSAGVITGAQLSTMLAALVSGWANTTAVPSGSSIVKIK